MKSDEIVIAAFLPISLVTPYAVARKLSELGRTLTNEFIRVLLPLASELDARDDPARLRALYVVGTRLTLAIFLPFACVLLVLGQQILAAWVGEAYGPYAYLVSILTLVGLIDTSQVPAGSVLQGMTRYRPLAIASVGSA
jgi:O-antigen/teichoic acid export membrane protein